jgi:hypothetical protein
MRPEEAMNGSESHSASMMDKLSAREPGGSKCSEPPLRSQTAAENFVTPSAFMMRELLQFFKWLRWWLRDGAISI